MIKAYFPRKIFLITLCWDFAVTVSLLKKKTYTSCLLVSVCGVKRLAKPHQFIPITTDFLTKKRRKLKYLIMWSFFSWKEKTDFCKVKISKKESFLSKVRVFGVSVRCEEMQALRRLVMRSIKTKHKTVAKQIKVREEESQSSRQTERTADYNKTL